MKLVYFSAPLMVALCSFDVRSLFAEPADPQSVAGSQAGDKLDAEQSTRLQQGLALATSGNPRAAISQFYDPVITFYETTYTDPHQHYLSARSTTEALLYLVEGANQHSATTVVSRNWVEGHFLKGYALVELQDLDAAHAEYERALKLAPRNAQVRCELGNIYNLRKEFTKALETYHIAEIDSEYSPPEAKDLDRARAWRGQGYAYVELRQWDDAERMYRQSMALDKSDRHSQKEIEYIQKQRSMQGLDTPHN